jgi:uncharacterized membrane-anchored protein
MNGEITGRARLGRRTKDLVKRLGPQDVAIVDHADIDRVSAEELAESGVRAVVNISRSSTGRFPNPGPLELVRAGVRLVDAPGAPLFDELADGDLVRLDGGSLWRNGTLVAEGTVLDAASLGEALADQQSRVSHALEAFAENTLRHLQEEAGSLAAGLELPTLRTRFRDRHVLVVAGGRGTSPTCGWCARTSATSVPCSSPSMGVPTRFAEAGITADVVVGDFDSVLGRRAPGRRRARRARLRGRRRARGGAARRLGSTSSRSPRPGSARTSRCSSRTRRARRLIVAVGTHFNLVEFLERDRAGMASTFVTRPQGRRVARRREGRLAARQPPRRHLAARPVRRDRRRGDRRRRSSHRPALRNVIESILARDRERLGLVTCAALTTTPPLGGLGVEPARALRRGRPATGSRPSRLPRMPTSSRSPGDSRPRDVSPRERVAMLFEEFGRHGRGNRVQYAPHARAGRHPGRARRGGWRRQEGACAQWTTSSSSRAARSRRSS